VFSPLEVYYDNALYKFTFDIYIDIDIGKWEYSVALTVRNKQNSGR